jgi:hypothetical protein
MNAIESQNKTLAQQLVRGEDIRSLIPRFPVIDMSPSWKSLESLINPGAQITESVNRVIGMTGELFRASVVSQQMATGELFNSLFAFELPKMWPLPIDFMTTLEVLRVRIQEGEDGRAVLAEMDEPWLTALYDAREFSSLSNSTSVERQAFLDDVVSRVLDADDFTLETRTVVESLDLTRPRWRLIDAALSAHYDEKYFYSIPLLLSQLEGMFADLLITSNLVKREGGKVVQIDPVTKLVKTSGPRNRPVRVSGLADLVKLSGFSDHAYLDDFAGFVVENTCGFRNGTLHGSSLDFDTKQNSCRTAMLLFIIAREFQGLAKEIELQD